MDMRDSNLTESLSEKLLKYKEIRILCEKTHTSPRFWILIIFIIVFMILFGFYENTLTILLGTLYPLYMSISTLKYGKNEDTEKWLCYWVTFIVFNWFEGVFKVLLLYIPLYNILRIIFLFLLYLPQFNFSMIIYKKIIRNIYNRTHTKISSFAKKIESALYQIETKSHIADNYISNSIGQILTKSLSKAHFKRVVSSNENEKQKEIEDYDDLSNPPFEKNPMMNDIDVSTIKGIDILYNNQSICDNTLESIDLNDIIFDKTDEKSIKSMNYIKKRISKKENAKSSNSQFDVKSTSQSIMDSTTSTTVYIKDDKPIKRKIVKVNDEKYLQNHEVNLKKGKETKIKTNSRNGNGNKTVLHSNTNTNTNTTQIVNKAQTVSSIQSNKNTK